MLGRRDWTDLPVYSAAALKRDLGFNARISNDSEEEISSGYFTAESEENEKSEIIGENGNSEAIDYNEYATAGKDEGENFQGEGDGEGEVLENDIQDRGYTGVIFENVDEDVHNLSVDDTIEDNFQVNFQDNYQVQTDVNEDFDVEIEIGDADEVHLTDICVDDYIPEVENVEKVENVVFEAEEEDELDFSDLLLDVDKWLLEN